MKPIRVDFTNCLEQPEVQQASIPNRTPLLQISSPDDAANYLSTLPSGQKRVSRAVLLANPIKVWLTETEHRDHRERYIILNWTGTPHSRWDWVALRAFKGGKSYICSGVLDGNCWQWAERGSSYVTNYNIRALEQSYDRWEGAYVIWDATNRAWNIKYTSSNP